MDMNGLPYLSSLNPSGVDDQFAQMLPARTAVDWRPTRHSTARSARTGMPLRAVVGQLCGYQAPSGGECGNCAYGNGPFVHCRVVLLPDPAQPAIQWSWACASCSYSSGGNKCSFRPENGQPPMWLINLVRTKNPSNPLLRHSNVLAAIAGAPAPAPATPTKSKKDKGKGRADGKNAQQLAGGAGKVAAGVGKVAAGAATPAGAAKTKRKDAGGDAGAAIPQKKAKTGAAAAGGTKKKKYPDVPPRVEVAPTPGPAYNYVWYHSPLAEPGVAHMSDVPGSVRAYAELKEVRKRLESDLWYMKKVLLAAGHIDDSDGGDGGESETSEGVFAGLE